MSVSGCGCPVLAGDTAFRRTMGIRPVAFRAGAACAALATMGVGVYVAAAAQALALVLVVISALAAQAALRRADTARQADIENSKPEEA